MNPIIQEILNIYEDVFTKLARLSKRVKDTPRNKRPKELILWAKFKELVDEQVQELGGVKSIESDLQNIGVEYETNTSKETKVQVEQNSFKKVIEDIVKEMANTAGLAVGPGEGEIEDPEGDEEEQDETAELRNLIQKTINELDYANDPETKEISARTAMKAAASKELEEEEEEEEETKEIKEVRRVVRSLAKQVLREQEEPYEEDSMVPEDPETSSTEPSAPLDMLKELMLADIEEFGRIKSSFEQYWGVIEDVFAEVDIILDEETKMNLASEFEYFKENPGEIKGEL